MYDHRKIGGGVHPEMQELDSTPLYRQLHISCTSGVQQPLLMILHSVIPTRRNAHLFYSIRVLHYIKKRY